MVLEVIKTYCDSTYIGYTVHVDSTVVRLVGIWDIDFSQIPYHEQADAQFNSAKCYKRYCEGKQLFICRDYREAKEYVYEVVD